MGIRFLSVLLPAFLMLSTLICAEDLVVARNGKSEYQIVTDGRSPKDVWNAKFLQWFIKEKTGAVLPVVASGNGMKKDKPSIFIGTSEPMYKLVGQTPFAEMAEQEHHVRSFGNDIVLFGKGYDADIYAIMEFIDRCFGVRFYQCFVTPEIKKEPTFVIKPFDYKIKYAFTYRMLGSSKFSDYLRGSNSYAERSQIVSYRRMIQSKEEFSMKEPACYIAEIQPEKRGTGGSHTSFRYIPHPGAAVPAYNFIKNKDYFKTNPEFFSMNQAGKRVPLQLCFGNPELRKEFTKNIEKHFDAIGTDDVKIAIEYDDCSTSEPCLCPECKKLKEKYGTPGAAYFEYLMEIGEDFQKRHPNTKITGILYRLSQTQIPPKFPDGKRFPSNVQFTFCSIHDYTNRTWDDPDNAKNFEDLKKWMKISENLRAFTYVPNYMMSEFLPSCNTNVLISNIRKLNELGIKEYFHEFYGFFRGYTAVYDTPVQKDFADLHSYLFYRLTKNPALDVKAEIKDCLSHIYGPAAPLAEKYHDELEYAFTTDNKYGIILGGSDFNTTLAYLTPERLLRWSKMFDEMQALVSENPLYKKNLAELRLSLDIAICMRWSLLASTYPDYFKDRNLFRSRIPQPNKGYIKMILEEIDTAFKYAGCEKPLPEQFKNIPPEKLVRKVPKNFNHRLKNQPFPLTTEDTDAAFGYAATIASPDKPFNSGFYQNDSKKHGVRIAIQDYEIEPGKYKLFHLGEIQPTPECSIWFSARSWATRLELGNIYDLKDTDAKWDAWVSLKFPENYTGKDSDIVLCDQVILIKK